MCCLMITTVWNVVMLRSNLIHHDGRWTRMISTTMIFSKCLFYCDTCTYGWICGTCISETVLMTMYDIPELHDYLSVSLSLSSKYPSIFLSNSLSKVSLSLSLTSFFWLYTNLISISFVLWTSLYKDFTFSNKNLNESMKCKLLLSPMCKNQDG